MLGGDDARGQRRLALDAPDFVVAVDSGLHRVDALGLGADVVVGDLDSVDPARLARAREAGVEVQQYSADKDQTDTELALGLVNERFAARSAAAGRPRLSVVGGSGGRLDMFLADVMLLAGPLTEAFDLSAHLGAATIGLSRPGRRLRVEGVAGEQVSLLAVLGAVRGVTTEGLRWPLAAGVLVPGSTRGLSNEMVGTTASVEVEDGVLVVMRQGIVDPVAAVRSGPYDPSPGG